MARLILASASAVRARLLRAAGVAFDVLPAPVDEDEIKASLRARGAKPVDVATALAELKAQRASARDPAAVAIGADQVLTCADHWYDKPADRAAAREQLLALRGRRHVLTTAVAVATGGRAVWRHSDSAAVTMRPFSDAFLAAYLDRAGEQALLSVGAYALEGHGSQLLERVEGDYFVVLGLPLLALLAYLREFGVLER